jgi:hypothetical protein
MCNEKTRQRIRQPLSVRLPPRRPARWAQSRVHGLHSDGDFIQSAISVCLIREKLLQEILAPMPRPRNKSATCFKASGDGLARPFSQ